MLLCAGATFPAQFDEDAFFSPVFFFFFWHLCQIPDGCGYTYTYFFWATRQRCHIPQPNPPFDLCSPKLQTSLLTFMRFSSTRLSCWHQSSPLPQQGLPSAPAALFPPDSRWVGRISPSSNSFTMCVLENDSFPCDFPEKSGCGRVCPTRSLIQISQFPNICLKTHRWNASQTHTHKGLPAIYMNSFSQNPTHWHISLWEGLTYAT